MKLRQVADTPQAVWPKDQPSGMQKLFPPTIPMKHPHTKSINLLLPQNESKRQVYRGTLTGELEKVRFKAEYIRTR